MADVYEMMMKIGLHGGILTDLAVVSDRLRRIHGLSNEIHASFSKWHIALGGIGAMIGGAAVLGGLEKMAKTAASFQEELVKAAKLGPEMKALADNGMLTKRAFELSKNVPMSVEDLLKIPNTAFSVAGAPEALRLWEPFAKYAWQQRSDSNFANTMGDAKGPMASLIRAGELTGRFTDKEGNFDEKKAVAFLDLMTKIKNATHGMVNEQTMLNFAQRAGPTARGLTDQGFMMEAIQMQAMGGHQAGTSLMSLWQQLAGGTMFKRTAEGMTEMGLMSRDDYKMDHGRVILSPEASKRLTGMVGKDPSDFVGAIVKQLDAKGITDPEDQQRMIMRMLNRQTTQRMGMEMVANRRQQRAERGRMGEGMGMEDAFNLEKNKSLSANLDAVSKAWHNFTVALAGPNAEQAISLLKSLTGVINSLTDKVRGVDPETLVGIGKGLAIMGAALVGGGAAALLVALGPAGWLVGGVAALVATFANDEKAINGMRQLNSVLSGLVTTEWEHITKGFETVKTAIGDFISWLERIGASIKHFLDLSRFLPSGRVDKSGFEGEGPRGRNILPANFSPGEKKQVLQPVQLNVNMDGRTLAQAVSEVLEDLYTHPTGPPQANGWDHFRPQGNYSDT